MATRITVRLRDTDAVGVLYFTEQMRMAAEVFEAAVSLREILDGGEFLIPIVHAEADYAAPLRLGDEVDVEMFVERLGQSSFTTVYQFMNLTTGAFAGSASITHVAIGRETWQSIPIPEPLRSVLAALPTAAETGVYRP
jgi:acyl-CoA thioesterase FadM